MSIRIFPALTLAALACTLLGIGTVAHAAPGGGSQGTHTGHHQSGAILHGQVLSVASGSFQLLPINTMPVTVTVGISTTITLAGMPGAVTDIQSGRFVAVAGRYDKTQEAFDATRVTVVVPAVSGRVTATNGSVFTMVTGHGITYQVTTTASTQFLALQAGRHSAVASGSGTPAGTAASSTPIAVATGDRVRVQGFPPTTGSNEITALRVWVRSSQATGGSGGTSGTGA